MKCPKCKARGPMEVNINDETGKPEHYCGGCNHTAPCKPKLYEVKILWGEHPEPGTFPTRYVFGTEPELHSFLMGVDAACGWMEYDSRIPEDKDYKTFKARKGD